MKDRNIGNKKREKKKEEKEKKEKEKEYHGHYQEATNYPAYIARICVHVYVYEGERFLTRFYKDYKMQNI